MHVFVCASLFPRRRRANKGIAIRKENRRILLLLLPLVVWVCWLCVWTCVLLFFGSYPLHCNTHWLVMCSFLQFYLHVFLSTVSRCFALRWNSYMNECFVCFSFCFNAHYSYMQCIHCYQDFAISLSPSCSLFNFILSPARFEFSQQFYCFCVFFILFCFLCSSINPLSCTSFGFFGICNDSSTPRSHRLVVISLSLAVVVGDTYPIIPYKLDGTTKFWNFNSTKSVQQQQLLKGLTIFRSSIFVFCSSSFFL